MKLQTKMLLMVAFLVLAIPLAIPMIAGAAPVGTFTSELNLQLQARHSMAMAPCTAKVIFRRPLPIRTETNVSSVTRAFQQILIPA